MLFIKRTNKKKQKFWNGSSLGQYITLPSLNLSVTLSSGERHLRSTSVFPSIMLQIKIDLT